MLEKTAVDQLKRRRSCRWLRLHRTHCREYRDSERSGGRVVEQGFSIPLSALQEHSGAQGIFATRVRRVPIVNWLLTMLQAANRHELEADKGRYLSPAHARRSLWPTLDGLIPREILPARPHHISEVFVRRC